MLLRLLPFVFVLFWSTGFIAAKYGLPFVEPYTFLAIRFVLVLLMLGAIMLLLRLSLPKNSATYWHLLVVAMTVQVMYLGGVFSAIKLGVPAGITAVIVGMQPILTALLIYRLRSLKVLLTSLLGFLGLLFVVVDVAVLFDTSTSPVDDGQQGLLSWQQYLPAFVALLGITFGTLYQKKYCAHVPVIVNAFVQFIPTCVVFIALTLLFEAKPQIAIEWHNNFILALFWSVVVLSIISILLMNLMYQHNSASSAASYFYLTPPVALLMGYVLFDETISVWNFVGIVCVVISVFISNKLKF